jgi:CheY-like chemotaxis protein
MLPEVDGLTVLRAIRRRSTMPVIVLSARGTVGDRIEGLETGADHYITKDADPQGILDLVRSITAAGPRGPRGPARRDSVDILSRVNELLDRKLFEATLLSELGRVARSLVNFDETFASVMRVLTRVVDFSVGGMAFVDEDELDVFLIHARRPRP